MNDAIYKIKKSTLDSIANAIRKKSGKTGLINPLNMPEEILALSTYNVSNTSLFDGSAFSTIAGSWVDCSGSLAGSINGGALTRTFDAYINDRTSQMIDVTDYNKLTVVFNNMSSSSSRTPFFGLWDTAPGNTVNDPTNFVAYTAITKTTDKTSYSIDIADITGSYYVGISLGMGGTYDSSYSIESIVLEARLIKPVIINGLTWSMPPVKSYEDELPYGMVTTNATYTASYNHMINEIFQITKDTTTGFSLGGQEYVRWYWNGNKHKVHSFMTRTKYNYLGRIRVYGEKEDGTLVQLSTDTITSDTAGSGYGYNNAALLDYQESVDKNTEFVAIQIWNNTTNGNQFNMRAYFQFWLI